MTTARSDSFSTEPSEPIDYLPVDALTKFKDLPTAIVLIIYRKYTFLVKLV